MGREKRGSQTILLKKMGRRMSSRRSKVLMVMKGAVKGLDFVVIEMRECILVEGSMSIGIGRDVLAGRGHGIGMKAIEGIGILVEEEIDIVVVIGGMVEIGIGGKENLGVIGRGIVQGPKTWFSDWALGKLIITKKEGRQMTKFRSAKES
jgi:hypothetical protein